MLTHLGAVLRARAIYNLNAATSYMETDRWMRENVYSLRRLRRREDLFDQVANAVTDREVLYLEFGVYKAESLTSLQQRLVKTGGRLIKHPRYDRCCWRKAA